MRPAGGFTDLATLEDSFEAGVAVGVQDALEVLEMGEWMLALAVGRVEVDGSWRLLALPWSPVAHIGPQPAGLRFTEPRLEHRHRRVIAMQEVRTEDLLAQRF